MSRGLFDSISANLQKESAMKESLAKEMWYKSNKELIWNQNMGPICCRVRAICDDKQELSRKLMDSLDEYFRYCQVPPMKWPTPPVCCPEQNPYPAPFSCQNEIAQRCPDPCDECCQDPTIPMKCVPDCQRAVLFQGLSHEGGGAAGYLKNRWNSGLPEYRFCRPPTVNSEYAWRITEHLKCKKSGCFPRNNTIGPAFCRHRGVLCRDDFAPFHFP
ncbi:unnamed protein product [Allacma fusca]|uniref:Sperm microtubule inner protein 1 C-terminal domain-containing protein n=1 Tax=Allacma fusca TaxID=39272 RepID=A0A8J2L3F4_9HEXA|nr:unnamed protein product [Allacma fusca]